MTLFFHELRNQQRLFWRNRQAAFFTFVLPVGLLAFGLLGRHSDVDGHPYPYFFVPGLIATAIVFTTFAGIAITLVVRRDSGILKRVRGTPLPPALYLGALAGSMALVLALEAVIIVAVGSTLLDLSSPDSPLELLALVVVGALAFAAMAFAVVPLVPAAEGYSAVISSIYFPLLGLSGAFFPLHRLPAGLHQLADVLPLSHLLSALRAAYAGGGLSRGDVAGLLVTLAWALAGTLIAVRRFGWEPRGGS
jgi:ABC-type multidrug transport system, permease component